MHVLGNSKSIFFIVRFVEPFYHFESLSHCSLFPGYKSLGHIKGALGLPQRLVSCCSEQVNVFSHKAVRVTRKVQEAGPEDKIVREEQGIWTGEPV